MSAPEDDFDRDDFLGLLQENAHLRARVERLRRALEAAKRKHIRTADGNYACPAGIRDGDRCNCGADRHNAAIDAALRGEA